MSSRIIERFVERYAEDAAFLWLLRDAATDAPHYRLRDLARLDERVEAQLDGLRIAGEPGWQIALSALQQYHEPGECFAAAVLALENPVGSRLDTVLEQAGTNPANARAVISALGWLEPSRLRHIVPSLLNDPRALRRLLGVAACSVHRVDPGTRLDDLLLDDPIVRARALRLSGEVGRVDVLSTIVQAIADRDLECRFWAGWSGVLLGNRREALAALMEHVETHGPREGRAWRVAVRALDAASARQWIRDLPNDHQTRRLIVEGAGILGDPALIPWLLERMQDPAVARLAGESFSLLTGADLEGEKLTSAPSEQDLEGDATLRRDEDLPWPDPGSIHSWWDKNRDRMQSEKKLLLGNGVAKNSLQSILAGGFQRQRRAAALELTLIAPGTPLFNCSARAARQVTRCHELAGA